MGFRGAMTMFLSVSAAAVVAGAVSVQNPKTSWDGVYSAEQASRGDALYVEHCGSCHAPDLSGKEGPALAGSEFLANWTDLSVGDMYERIRISMPQDAPGSLTPEQNADILAFILSKNKFPAGTSALPASADVLKTIVLLAEKP